jgi:membrane protein DedA with SNARE-associated domain
VTHFLQSYGLPILFLLVALESCGVPVPGETALLAAAVLASRGHFAIEWVIVVAAAGAIVGDNLGYWIGREGGRRLLARWGPLERFADRVLPPAERFFEKHGGKTVFLARFVTGIRVTAAWMAGISRMRWWEFLAWNAAGGIVWATAYGLLAYYVGDAAIHAISRYGAIGAGVVVVLAVLIFGSIHYWKKRLLREAA